MVQVRGLQALVSNSDALACTGWEQMKSNMIFHFEGFVQSSQLHRKETFAIKGTYRQFPWNTHIAVKQHVVFGSRTVYYA